MYRNKISVIIPTYNRSQYLSRAIDSVLDQSFKNYEIIVVDDNGINTQEGLATEKVMNNYIDNEKVIYLQHEVNKNGSAARNTGIRKASGQFISFLDDDDTYLPDRLGLMVKKLEGLDESWGACYTSYVKHQVNGNIQYSKEKVEGDVYIQALMRSLYIGSGSNLFFRRSAIEEVGYFDETFTRNQDLEYLVRVLSKYKMAYVDEILLEIFYDSNRNRISLNQSIERENIFRQKFSNYLNKVSSNNSREIKIMWDIDWIRTLIYRKQYYMAFRALLKSKIPINILIKYACYSLDRYINKTCYGFVVKLN